MAFSAFLWTVIVSFISIICNTIYPTEYLIFLIERVHNYVTPAVHSNCSYVQTSSYNSHVINIHEAFLNPNPVHKQNSLDWAEIMFGVFVFYIILHDSMIITDYITVWMCTSIISLQTDESRECYFIHAQPCILPFCHYLECPSFPSRLPQIVYSLSLLPPSITSH